ncbi:hypothetical protein B0T20DRAFT_364238 [Sordaria brevicollis]|uniref:Apple domain-containing protein n=1 Tax=Sordaria brevicollis TaxID=83679 RepID=A0AAE0NWN7_SORBR|nr:hypothetical protein B0T20DRAFT_364238 [Sordaria brevicollis]
MDGLQVVGRPGGNRRSGEDLPEVAHNHDAPEVVLGAAPEVMPLTTYDGEKLPVSVTAAPYGYQHSHSPSPAPPESQPLFYPPAHLQQPGQYDDPPGMYGGSQMGYPPSQTGERSTVPPNKKDGRICGMKRTLFLILLAGGGLLLMGIAIGVGVGVGVGNKSDSDIPSKTTATATATSSSAPAAPTNCPDIGERTYTTKNGKKFLHTCGIDYAGEGEANDLTNAKTSTFDECIEKCATTSGCTGAGWEDLQYDGGDKYRRVCWMKNNLQRSHTAEMTYSFAALVE